MIKLMLILLLNSEVTVLGDGCKAQVFLGKALVWCDDPTPTPTPTKQD